MTKFCYLFILVLWFTVFYRCISLSQNGISVRDSKYDNLELSKDLIIEYNGVTATIDCALFCAGTLSCMSFTLNEEKQKCRLHRAAAISLSQGLKSEGWMYFIYGEQCPVSNGFIHDRENGLCIKISEQQLKADEGEQFCTDNSAKLITLETANKQARFDRLLAKTPYKFVTSRYRIGLHYVAQQWVWNNGDVLSYDNWEEDEPNCGCNCGGVTVDSAGWYDNDVNCLNRIAQSVCEIKLM
jgi:hypothetical protein